MDLLKMHSIDDVTVLLYYQAEHIKIFSVTAKYGMNIRYVKPERDFGTAGAVKLTEEYIKDDFLVISGDVLTDFNLSDVHKFHKEKIPLQHFRFSARKIRCSSELYLQITKERL